MRVAHLTTMYSTPEHPLNGHAVESLIDAIRQSASDDEHKVQYFISSVGTRFLRGIHRKYRGEAKVLFGESRRDHVTPWPMPLLPKQALHRITNPWWQRHRLRNIVESFHCDIIHVHMNYHLAFGAALAARAKGIPLVLTLRREADLSRHPRWKREQLIQAYKMADLIISPSASLKRYCQQATGLDVTLIPSGTDPLFDELPEIPPRRENRLLFVGALDSNKAILPLVDAVLDLYGQEMDFEFVIVGDGPLRKQVAQRAARDSRIALRGKVSRREVREEMRHASLLCVPSYTETLGLVYIEAMKQGLPVVGRAGTGIDGLGEQGVHYELVESDASIASLLGALMKDDPKRARLAENGRTLASQWTWELAAERHREEYTKLISGMTT